MVERGEQLDNIQDKTDNLAQAAQGFRKGANRVRKDMWWKDMKMRMCLIAGIIILIVVIVNLLLPFVSTVLMPAQKIFKVTVIGSGNWYLTGIKLPENIVAVPDLLEAVQGADILVFNVPHQFLRNICRQLAGHVPRHVRAISCLKGLDVSADSCVTLSQYITNTLGIHCGALSGANLALEIAQKKYSESTIAYRLPADYVKGQDVDNQVLYTLFHRPYFHINVVDDVTGVCLAGALKNVIAIAAGFVAGAGWGDNAKAAIMRRGLLEMIQFGLDFFGGDIDPATFLKESAGVADLITSRHKVSRQLKKSMSF
ncbi:hypothetical protein D0Z03_002479 [Geotrichum reessii]|nr:hypothetical protein D0Z03_002479 [Galactomyces reessii]